MIKIENLSKRFGELMVFEGIDLHIKKGECVAVIGPSGMGKSVLFRTIALLEKPDSGKIWINNVEITNKQSNINKVREKMGMVYQGFHLFSHLSIIDNITLAPRKVKKQSRVEAEKKAMELLSMVGLTDKAHAFPRQLSGGQQQRVAIARCLAMEPEIILFDEPTSALDPAMTSEVLAIIRKLTKMGGLTMLIVTHEMNFAKEVSSRVLFMEEKGIYEDGTPEQIFENPRKEKTKNFIRRLKIFTYTIDSKGFDMVAMNVQIELFCRKYHVEQKKIYHLQLIIEETIVILFQTCYLSQRPQVEFGLELSSDLKEIAINLNYISEEYNPFSANIGGEENLGLMLVKNIAKTINHSYMNGQNSIYVQL
jgi:polar amino acid transport system ATP-binding protein